jgi:hypothetical protein
MPYTTKIRFVSGLNLYCDKRSLSEQFLTVRKLKTWGLPDVDKWTGFRTPLDLESAMARSDSSVSIKRRFLGHVQLA